MIATSESNGMSILSKASERMAMLKRKKADRRRNKRHEKSAGKSTETAQVQSDDVGEPGGEFEIEYIPETISDEYASLLSKFAPVEPCVEDQVAGTAEYSAEMANILEADAQRRAAEAAAFLIADSYNKMSNKDKRSASRMSIAALKAQVSRPDLVDGMDNCSPDPTLLLACKSYKNTVQVPRHWSNKRNYLANKRGIDKVPFKLPEYVEQTGIAKIRQAVLAKEAEKDIKAKQRAKMRPKTGKLDIDYKVLYNAFFKYQTKPSFMTKFGDIYYEGREAETRYVQKKPGQVSPLLREALGMIEGSPPPWLINMQRFGPPPSYPNLKIPGLNSPIPLGAEWGYHPGGWGKPPVDEFGNPVYGGLWNPDKDRAAIVDLGNLNVRQGLWGEYVEESSDDEDDEVTDVIPTPSVPAPAAPAPIYSQGVAVTLFPPTAAGPQVPVATGAGPQALYRVLPQKSASMDAGALFPSRNVYDVADPAGGIATAQGISQRATEVEDETVLTADMIKQKLAEHEAKSGETSKRKKKQKFKF